MKKLISVALALVLVLSLSVVAFAADTVTVYCEAPEDWETCHVHYWGTAQGDSAWPGVDMTKGDDGIWYAEIPADVAGLLFNMEGDTGKTVDLTLPTDGNTQFVIGNSEWVKPGTKSEIVEKYYVAGDEALCGVNWVQNAEANLMTEGENGIWTKTFSDVAAGTYNLKVTDGTWNNSWGDPNNADSGNFSVTLEEAGNITVTFNAVEKVVSVSVGGEVITPEPPAENPPAEKPPVDDTPVEEKPGTPSNYYVTGSTDYLSNWNVKNEDGRMNEISAGVYQKVFKNLPAGEYELKVNDGSWTISYGTADGQNYYFSVSETCDVEVTLTMNGTQGTVAVRGSHVSIPGTDDFGMHFIMILLVLATAATVVLVINKKKFI